MFRDFYQDFLDNVPEGGVDRYIHQTILRLNIPPGRSGKSERECVSSTFLTQVIDQGMEAVRRNYVRDDEHEHDVKVTQFQLSRSACLNAWYRLYDPTHGRSKLIAKQYDQHSQADDQPAIFVSWFDAWAFSQWARWDNGVCRLPWEHEWEYACKFGTPWNWNFWWHKEDFDPSFANAGGTGQTNAPSADHVNPNTVDLDPAGIGLQDMTGNVWEWCMDIYRNPHDRNADDNPGSLTGSRVLRGGSFVSQRRLLSVGLPQRQATSQLRTTAYGLRLARA